MSDSVFVTISGTRLAKLRFMSLHPQPAVGGGELVLMLELDAEDGLSKQTVFTLNATLTTKQRGIRVADAAPQSELLMPGDKRESVNCFFLLTALQVAGLEERRDGPDAPMELHARVNVEAREHGGIYLGAKLCNFDISIPGSEWRRALETLGHGRRVVFEVPIEGSPIPCSHTHFSSPALVWMRYSS